MPILKGKNTVRANMKELLKGKIGKSRSKAIATIAKKRGISKADARLIQAKAIAMSAARAK